MPETSLATHRQVGGEVLVRAEAAARHRVASGGDPLAQVRDRSRPEGDVDERVQLEDALALGLRVAAADGDHHVRVAPLPRRSVPEIRRQPRVRLLADGARVEDEHVGVVGRRRLTEAERLEHALDALGVVRVHLTAERGDVVTPHRAAIVGVKPALHGWRCRPAATGARGDPAARPTRPVARRRGRRRRSAGATSPRPSPRSRPAR